MLAAKKYLGPYRLDPAIAIRGERWWLPRRGYNGDHINSGLNLNPRARIFCVKFLTIRSFKKMHRWIKNFGVPRDSVRTSYPKIANCLMSARRLIASNLLTV